MCNILKVNLQTWSIKDDLLSINDNGYIDVVDSDDDDDYHVH